MVEYFLYAVFLFSVKESNIFSATAVAFVKPASHRILVHRFSSVPLTHTKPHRHTTVLLLSKINVYHLISISPSEGRRYSTGNQCSRENLFQDVQYFSAPLSSAFKWSAKSISADWPHVSAAGTACCSAVCIQWCLCISYIHPLTVSSLPLFSPSKPGIVERQRRRSACPLCLCTTNAWKARIQLRCCSVLSVYTYTWVWQSEKCFF